MDTPEEQKKIKVLVVDDSALMSRQIANILSSADGIEVVGRAKDGKEALALIEELNPDVITLDVEMPTMNGLTALKHIMVKYAIPTVMLSALTTEAAQTTFDSLKFGAIDVVAKPSKKETESLEAQKADIISKVKRAAFIDTGRLRYLRLANPNSRKEKKSKGQPTPETRFIVIGAGVGGYYSLLRIIPALPADFPGVVISVMTTAPRYIDPFVAFLDNHSFLPVRRLEDRLPAERGVCYICSAQEGFLLGKTTDSPILFAKHEPMGSFEPRSVDAMFRSVARVIGTNAVGVILSGAGTDGAEGISAIRKSGGISVIQDINNCMDPSMPLAALEKGLVERVLPDYRMADYFVKLCSVREQHT